jgi:hypothetical protein
MDSIFQAAVDDIEEALTKIGLYLFDAEFGAIPADEDALAEIMESKVDPVEAFKNGLTKVFLNTTFTLGDIAFSDRVLHPEKYDEQKQFNMIVPTESEIELELLKEDLLNWDDE